MPIIRVPLQVTIDGVVYVVDCGFTKLRVANPSGKEAPAGGTALPILPWPPFPPLPSFPQRPLPCPILYRRRSTRRHP